MDRVEGIAEDVFQESAELSSEETLELKKRLKQQPAVEPETQGLGAEEVEALRKRLQQFEEQLAAGEVAKPSTETAEWSEDEGPVEWKEVGSQIDWSEPAHLVFLYHTLGAEEVEDDLGYDPSDPPDETDGVSVKVVTDVVYNAEGDKVLYAFYRYLTWPQDRAPMVGSEERGTIDTPEECG